MKFINYSLLFFLVFSFGFSQDRQIAIDTTVITKHQTKIRGEIIDYTAYTGTQPVWNNDGNAIATLFYTYYKRDNLSNLAKRPIIFSFNGGPGSASVWMHMAYTGPYTLNVDNEGYPIQPYGYKQNPYSILDVADIIFINPVNTAYSRILEVEGKKEPRETFFGIDADIKYLAE